MTDTMESVVEPEPVEPLSVAEVSRLCRRVLDRVRAGAD